MGACCSVSSSSMLYIDFHRSCIVRESKNSKFLFSYNSIIPSFLNPSVTMLNEDNLFFIGGKDLTGVLQKSCFQLSVSKRLITRYSDMNQGACKGFSFVYEQYLYYIFSKTNKKAAFSFLRLEINKNQWEDLDFRQTSNITQQLTIKDLKNPGLAFRKNSLYLIGGLIPRAKIHSTTIFQVEFPEMNVYNLNLDLSQPVCKPLSFFIGENLFIILSDPTNSQRLICFNKEFNMSKSDLQYDTKLLRPYTPILSLSETSLILNSELLVNFENDSLKLLQIKKNARHGKAVLMQLHNKGYKETKKVEIFPLPLKVNKEVSIEFENFEDSDPPFESCSSRNKNSSRESLNDIILFSAESNSAASTIKPTHSDLKIEEKRDLPSHVVKNDSDKVKKFTELSFEEDSSLNDLNKKHLGIFDRSGKKLSSELMLKNIDQAPSRVSMPFSVAASYADPEDKQKNSLKQISIEPDSCSFDSK